jgi:hypothetical protein
MSKKEDSNNLEINNFNCIQYLDFYLKEYRFDPAGNEKALEAWELIKNKLGVVLWEESHLPYTSACKIQDCIEE